MGRLRLLGIALALACANPLSAVAATNIYYRSIGTAPPYAAGTVAAKDGFVLIVGTGTAWKSANRGRGDRIRIDGSDYTILEVLSEDRLVITEPFNGVSASGKTYQIERKFTSPYAWNDCIGAISTVSLGCHDVFSGSLIADDRSEVGIFYKDSRFVLDSGVLRIDGAATDLGHTITMTADPGNRHHGLQGTGVVFDRNGNVGALLEIGVDYMTVEWLELTNSSEFIVELQGVNDASDVILRNLILHNSDQEAIFLSSGSKVDLSIYNNFIFDGRDNGIHFNIGLTDGARIDLFNNTLFDIGNKGIVATNGSPSAPVVTLQNNISVATANSAFDVNAGLRTLASASNIAGDGNGVTHSPAGGGQDNVSAGPAGVDFMNMASGSEDLHINPANPLSAARDRGTPLAGIVDDDIDESPRVLPWDVGADEVSAQPVQYFTATSQNDQVTLEWVAPDVGPYASTLIVVSTVGPPSVPADGTPVPCPVPPLGAKGICVDGAAANGATYYYGAFVDADGVNNIFSPVKTAEARPIDPTAPEKKRWSYTTGATMMEPPGLGSFRTPPWTVHAASNDFVFHAMQSGPTGGTWPLGWTPARIGAPAQHRTTVLPVSSAPFSLQLGYVANQNGSVFAIDGDTGDRIWETDGFGALAPSVAAVLTELGAPSPYDFVFVGTRVGGGNDHLYALHVGSGKVAARFDNGLTQFGDGTSIGEIGGMAVIYPGALPEPRILFTSRDAGSGHTLWLVRLYEVAAGTFDFALEWTQNVGGGIDTSPVIRNDVIYVGGKDENIHARNLVDGSPLWVYTPTFAPGCVGFPAGDGEIKGFIFPFGPTQLVFSTNTTVWSIDDLGGSACTTPGWPLAIAGPSTPLVAPGTGDIFVGSTDGNLYRIPPTGAAATVFTFLGAPAGAPTFDGTNNMIYVGSSDGIVYAVTYP